MLAHGAHSGGPETQPGAGADLLALLTCSPVDPADLNLLMHVLHDQLHKTHRSEQEQRQHLEPQ